MASMCGHTALAADPRILICYEITSALDATAREVVIDLLDDLRRTGLALISHQSPVLDRLADSVLTLDETIPQVFVQPATG